MKKSSKIILIIAAIICAIVVAIVAVVLLGHGGGKSYEKHLELAQRYLEDMDYDRAIAELKAAIEIEPKNSEAYLALADVYVEMGDYESAIATLEEGVENAGGRKLEDRLAEVWAEYERMQVGTNGNAGQNSSGEQQETEEQPEPQPLDGRNGRVMTIEEIVAANVGDIVTFGAYEQDNDMSNGKEPIEWFVLDKDGEQITLLSVYLLDEKQYHSEQVDITWENCTLRSWLNSEFYDAAFTETEKGSIRTTDVKNADNPFYGTEYGSHGGNDTADKVWLLSLGEIERYFHIPMTRETNPYYNRALNWGEYALYCYDQDHRVIAKPTAYARAMGCYALTSENAQNWYEGYDFSHTEGGGWWWLRSPGDNGHSAAFVSCDGYVRYYGDVVNGGSTGVRPALKLGY